MLYTDAFTTNRGHNTLHSLMQLEYFKIFLGLKLFSVWSYFLQLGLGAGFLTAVTTTTILP